MCTQGFEFNQNFHVILVSFGCYVGSLLMNEFNLCLQDVDKGVGGFGN